MTKKLNGWMMQSRMFRKDRMPVEVTDWDLLLRELKLDESGAIELLRKGGEGVGKLRRWLQVHSFSRFVPEKVLEAAELKVNVELRFPID